MRIFVWRRNERYAHLPVSTCAKRPMENARKPHAQIVNSHQGRSNITKHEMSAFPLDSKYATKSGNSNRMAQIFMWMIWTRANFLKKMNAQKSPKRLLGQNPS